MKIPKLLVDNLRHISDHGLAVEFTDKKLVDMVNGMKKDGTYKLEAGQSWLKLRVVGRMCFTEFYKCHGNYNTKKAHYFDEPAGLKFTLNRGSVDEEHAHDTLMAVALGGPMPTNWRNAGNYGSSQDELRKWLKNWAWTLAGENGMRAKALEKVAHDEECDQFPEE